MMNLRFAVVLALVLTSCQAPFGSPTRTVVAAGPIAPEMAADVSAHLSHNTLVLLDSAGGYYFPARDMAKAIYWAGASTRVDGQCASACVLVFAAGSHRSMSRGSRIGVHGMIGSVAAEKEEVQILRNLGMPPHIIREMLDTPFTELRWLTSAEIAEWGVVVD